MFDHLTIGGNQFASVDALAMNLGLPDREREDCVAGIGDFMATISGVFGRYPSRSDSEISLAASHAVNLAGKPSRWPEVARALNLSRTGPGAESRYERRGTPQPDVGAGGP
jgi:hypothetical protein